MPWKTFFIKKKNIFLYGLPCLSTDYEEIFLKNLRKIQTAFLFFVSLRDWGGGGQSLGDMSPKK